MRSFITGGFRLLTVVANETLVLRVFNSMTDALVEAGINGLGTTDGDGSGWMEGVRLLDTGGLRSLAMALDETSGRCTDMANTWMSVGVRNA